MDGARSMRAVRGSLGHSLLERNERAWEDLSVASLDGRSQNAARPCVAENLVGEMRREKTPGTFSLSLDWRLDLFFSKDLVQFRTTRPPTLSPAEDEPDKQVSPALVGAGIDHMK
jgi:hypothetical protein